MAQHVRKGIPLDTRDAAQLRAVIRELGDWRVADALGVSPQTVARAAAELPLYAHTYEQVVTRLGDLRRAA